MRIALVVLVAAAMSSCVVPARYATGNDGRTVAWKRVEAKDPPATLIAIDGSVCTVTSDRFERTQRGDRVACLWVKGR